MDFILHVAHPHIGVFTAIDAVHSEQFGSPANIANEEIKMALHTTELVFLNVDDIYAMQLFPSIQVDKLTYQTQGYQQEADITFSTCHFILGEANHELQSVFSLNLKEKKYIITTNLIGKANYGYIGVALAIVEVLHFQQRPKGATRHDTEHCPMISDGGEVELSYTLQP
jgi:UDP-N-acetylmuramyl pentapeptide synthase